MALGFCAILIVTGCTREALMSPEADNAAAVTLFGNLQNGAQHTFGWVPAPASELAKIPYALDKRTALPASFLIGGPPIGNQGSQGSCVAWGTAYTGRSILKQEQSGGAFSASTNEFSPAYVYDQIKIGSGCGGGSYVTSALSLLKTQGVCTLASMPYTTTCSALPTTALKTQAATFKINGYSLVTITPTAVKTQIAAGHAVIVAGPVDNNFENLPSGQVLTTYNPKKYLGGHCYVAIGYDDSKQAFKIQNQWGTSWSSAGYAWISYNLIGTIWQEAYTLN